MKSMSTAPTFRLGFDIGGTFTDFVLVDEQTGEVHLHKVLTTPREPARAVIGGLEQLLSRSAVEAGTLKIAIHATTLITNALIERKGARTALLTTEGFRDVLEMGTEVRYDIYDLFLEKPEPLVPRRWRYEVVERLDNDGHVLTPLDGKGLRSVAARLRRDGVEAVGIVFLHAFRNPEHERQAQAVLAKELPDLSVCISSEVAPEIREFDRMSTTVANAYVQPLAHSYIADLERRLAEVGYRRRIFYMLSSGGITTAETAMTYPIRLVESGPAAGVLATAYYCRYMDLQSVISFDMGGTTAKIGLVRQGVAAMANAMEVGRVKRFKRGSGLPIKIPVIEMIEIGAGGGSIAYVDALGLLKVGPQSAGAEPGPACYGRGGAQPTVTDANLVLGYLDPGYFLGGAMALDADAARRAIETALARPLNLSVVDAARGIFEVVNQNMLSAMKVHIAERGEDPRKFYLVAFGGAGPAHAYELARALRMRGVVVPPNAGNTSAMGLVTTAASFDFARSFVARVDRVPWEELRAVFEAMENEGRARVADAGIDRDDPGVQVARRMDLRHRGQGYELTVEIPADLYGKGSIADLVQLFYERYEAKYGHAHRNLAVELITCRVSVSGPPPEVSLHRAPDAQLDTALARKGNRDVYFAESEGYVETPVFDRYRLGRGVAFMGPAVIEERECTVIAGPSSRIWVDDYGNLFLDVASRGRAERAAAAQGSEARAR
jgi:N-methylhydantoinase A/oxoprolinase/acetone carboxylase beta subunit